jgi:DNA-directed RNA polymerase I, II, and III subunit RPABC1
MAPRYKIEHFKEAELLVDITDHILVPQHEVLTSEAKAELLARCVQTFFALFVFRS